MLLYLPLLSPFFLCLPVCTSGAFKKNLLSPSSFFFSFPSSTPAIFFCLFFCLITSVHLFSLTQWPNAGEIWVGETHIRDLLSCLNITWDWGGVTRGDSLPLCMHYALASISLGWCVYISMTDVSIGTRCRCVWVKNKIQTDVFISHLPQSWPHARCPLPPMTQCPSAP